MSAAGASKITDSGTTQTQLGLSAKPPIRNAWRRIRLARHGHGENIGPLASRRVFILLPFWKDNRPLGFQRWLANARLFFRSFGLAGPTCGSHGRMFGSVGQRSLMIQSNYWCVRPESRTCPVPVCQCGALLVVVTSTHTDAYRNVISSMLQAIRPSWILQYIIRSPCIGVRSLVSTAKLVQIYDRGRAGRVTRHHPFWHCQVAIGSPRLAAPCQNFRFFRVLKKKMLALPPAMTRRGVAVGDALGT